jgi:hypothetical protein
MCTFFTLNVYRFVDDRLAKGGQINSMLLLNQIVYVNNSIITLGKIIVFFLPFLLSGPINKF